MQPSLSLVPAEASTIAGQVDLFAVLLLIVTLSVSVLVVVLLVTFVLAYRRRAPGEGGMAIRGDFRVQAPLVVALVGLAVVATAWGAYLYLEMTSTPANAEPIYVVAKQWMWKAQHMGGQEEINEVHIPVGRPVVLTMTSQDVVHDFDVPEFRVKADVLPGRYTNLSFEANQAGTYQLFCDQYCGTSHAMMVGTIVAMAPSDYAAWLQGGAFLSPAGKGQQLFTQLGCNTCHRNDTLRRAPVLEGLYGRPVQLASGQTVIADDAYIRESILDPGAQVVNGWQDIMPSFQGRVSETQLVQLVAYVKSLQTVSPGLPPPSAGSNTILTPTSGTPTSGP
jgi:cytochrome c oxidase subunit 2